MFSYQVVWCVSRLSKSRYEIMCHWLPCRIYTLSYIMLIHKCQLEKFGTFSAIPANLVTKFNMDLPKIHLVGKYVKIIVQYTTCWSLSIKACEKISNLLVNTYINLVTKYVTNFRVENLSGNINLLLNRTKTCVQITIRIKLVLKIASALIQKLREKRKENFFYNITVI